MKPFAMQTVLDYRKRLEDLAQRRFIEAQKNLQIIQQKLEHATRDLDLFIAESTRQQQEGIGITELIRYEEGIAAQQQNVRAIEKTLQEKELLVQKEQQNLTHRCRERQIMERLKESQNKAWQVYLNKKEAAMLDEIATTRHDAKEW